MLAGGYTPPAPGGDVVEVPVPYDPADGTTLVTWTLRRITLRVETAGGTPTCLIEKSTVAGAFSGSTIGTLTMVAGNYEVAQTAGLGTIQSGNKMRFNVSDEGTALHWTITVEMNRP